MAAPDWLAQASRGRFFVDAATPPTAAEIKAAVWGETIPGSYPVGSAGYIVGKIFKLIKYLAAS